MNKRISLESNGLQQRVLRRLHSFSTYGDTNSDGGLPSRAWSSEATHCMVWLPYGEWAGAALCLACRYRSQLRRLFLLSVPPSTQRTIKTILSVLPRILRSLFP